MKPSHFREIEHDCCNECQHHDYVQDETYSSKIKCIKHDFIMSPYTADDFVCDDFERHGAES